MSDDRPKVSPATASSATLHDDVDTLIVGAGLSGLSLAVALVDSRVGGRIVLVDPRTDYGWDRTWCFWPVEPHPFEAAVSHRWHRWRVAAPGGEVTREAPRLPYCHIRSHDLYELAWRRLEASGRVERRLGVSVESLSVVGARVHAETSGGPIVARLAFDSRPPPELAGSGQFPEVAPSEQNPADAREVRLLQHFGGLVVQTDEPCFDPDCVTLMDFDVGDPGDRRSAVHFMYVLPFDADRALVEDTWISAHQHEPTRYEDEVDHYVRDVLGAGSYEIVDRERGIIPMATAQPRRPRGRIVPIGLRGGLAKPSSGYAFVAVQRDSAALAESFRGWSGGELPDDRLPTPPPQRPARTLALDRIFLAHLARHPERAPDLFFRLFEAVEPAALVRFLSEAGDWRDDVRVMRALPAGPLIAEALRSYRLWLR